MKGYYYDLLYAIDNLVAAQKNLDLAKKLLDENEIRVKVGTMAPLDVVTAQSEVASREEGVIVAENALAEAEDNLKRVIFPRERPRDVGDPDRPHRPAERRARARSTSTPRCATRSRTGPTSWPRARASSAPTTPRCTRRNQLLPQLDLVANYGGTGAGGTQIVRDPPIGGPVVDTDPRRLRRRARRGLRPRLPHLDRRRSTSRTRSRTAARKASARPCPLAKDQALASFRRLELQVAAEVRTAARGVESGFKRVASTQAARGWPRERLDAEEKKFAAGMSTNFFVTQAQRDLAVAEVNELRAIADYRKSVDQLPARAGSRRLRQRRAGGAQQQRQRRPGQPGGRGPAAAGRPVSRSAFWRPRRPGRQRKGGLRAPFFFRPVFTASLQPRGPLAPSRADAPGLNCDDMATARRRLLWLLLVPVLLAGGFLLLRGRGEATQFTTGTIDRGDVVEVVGATGILEAVTTVQLGSQVSGTIESLYADFNSTVKKGQVVARLDPSIFEARLGQAHANLLAAKANVERARSTVEDTRQKYERAQELAAQKLLPVDRARDRQGQLRRGASRS